MPSVTACVSDMPHLSQVKLGIGRRVGFGVTDRIASVVPPGLSLKFWRVAAAESDIYLRLGRTMELDGGWQRSPSS